MSRQTFDLVQLREHFECLNDTLGRVGVFFLSRISLPFGQVSQPTKIVL